MKTGRRLLLALIVAAFAAHATAQTVDGIEQAWRDWMDKYHKSSGGLVVLHNGLPVREVAMGRMLAEARPRT